MKTADTEILQQEDDDRRSRTFEYRMRDFQLNWMPDDPHEAVQFETELFMLCKQIYRDAQKPILEHLTQVAMSSPLVGRGPL